MVDTINKAPVEYTGNNESLQHLQVVLNSVYSRAAIAALGSSFDGKRDLYKVLGYPKEISFDDHLARYRRGDIASRLIDIPVDRTWSGDIEVQEDNDSEKETEFEKAWKSLSKRLKIFRVLKKADRLRAFGRYSVILIGVKGAGELKEPVEKASAEEIIFLKPYAESQAKVDRLVTDEQDPRFGLPETYRLDISDGVRTVQKRVHRSRIIHVCDDLLSDETEGIPDLEQVFNRLLDLEKVVGGASEMFWQGADRVPTLELDKDARLSPEDKENLKTMIESFYHGLNRVLHVQGGKVGTLDTSQPDPTGNATILLQLIAGTKGIPMRILVGSERGELASSQDQENLAGMIADRTQQFAEPKMLRPLIERFQSWQALPAAEVKVNWPPAFELSPTELAEVQLKRSQAVKNLAPMGSPDELLTLQERREMLDFRPDPDPSQQLSVPELNESDQIVQEAFAEMRAIK